MQMATVKVEQSNVVNCIADAQFYYVDFDELERAVSIIRNRAVEDIDIDEGIVDCNVKEAKDGEALYLTVPYEKGWKVIRNGQKIIPETIGNCMLSIPLVEGENDIHMEYHAQGIWLGRILSLLGIVLTLIITRNKKSDHILANVHIWQNMRFWKS